MFLAVWFVVLRVLRPWPWWFDLLLAGAGLWGIIVLYVPFDHISTPDSKPETA